MVTECKNRQSRIKNTNDPNDDETAKEEPVVKEVVEEPSVPTQQLTFVETEGETSTYDLTGAENI